MKRELLARCAALGVACLLGATACQTATKTTEAPPMVAEREKATASEASAAPAPAASLALESVYFDYDRWELGTDARLALKKNAQKIQSAAGGERLVVEGHSDERGSEEYNLALGDRRAAAVKRYLQDLGVPASRLRTVSFGESRPAATGHDESAWRVNRRSEIRPESRSASR